MKSRILLLTVLFVFSFSCSLTAQNITINELCSNNVSFNTDEDGDYEDWIEFYNYGSTPINLNGYGLSDDITQKFKWVFPNVTLNAGQYLLVWCSDKNKTVAGSPLHTNFKINASGEILYLTNPSAVTIITLPGVSLQQNVSYGRSPNGTGSYFFFSQPTPGAANSTTTYSEALSPPTFSHAGGFYTSGFNLTLSSPSAGASIIYTLDGSDPSETNTGSGTTYTHRNQYAEQPGQAGGPFLQKNFKSFTYTAPLPIADRTSSPNKLSAISTTHHFAPDYFPSSNIFKGTVVRAKVVKPGAIASPTVSHTFFVTPLGLNKFSLPVVSLSVNENKFFDRATGIMIAGNRFDNWRAANPSVATDFFNADFDANYFELGNATERTGNMSYYVNGNEVVNQDIGLRLNGGTSRAWQNKSFRLISRADLGKGSMDYKFFPDENAMVFERLILRNSGGDFFNTMYRDALAQKIAKGIGVETQAYQPSITFVNGEYWGILNIRERYDNNYFKNIYGIPSDQLDLLEDDMTPSEGDAVHYNAMLNFLQNNSLTVQSNFDYIKTQMDIDNIRDYYITEIFYDNTDWPGWNVVYWRKRTSAYTPNAPYGQDGRWRTAFKDLDDAFGFSSGISTHDNLAQATDPNGPPYPNPPQATLVLRSLLANNTFKNNFINRFADLLNTYFLSSRMQAVSDQMKSVIEPEMLQNLNRWNQMDYSSWSYSVGAMNSFLQSRPQNQRNHIRSKFGISSNITATLNVSNSAHGYIKINTINILPSTPGVPTNTYPWSGIYFHNIPITLKAVPISGYQFSNWSGASSSTSPEITITPTANFSITANFVPTGQTPSPEIIYFWMIDDAIPNDLPLTSVNSTYEMGPKGVLTYQSCIAGYPLNSLSTNWRKGSMERRNNPTTLNYIPSANNNLTYANSNMRGLQIKQPFQNGGAQNTMIFNFSTENYKDIKFAFAVVDEGAATGVTIDYSINEGNPVWITTGMTTTSYPITASYQRIEVNFTPIFNINNNPHFKVRLRFTGPNMTADNGGKVTFNNISVQAVPFSLGTNAPELANNLIIYPNPVTDFLNIETISESMEYSVYGIDGRLINKGMVANKQINMSDLPSGVYLLILNSDGQKEMKKIVKK